MTFLHCTKSNNEGSFLLLLLSQTALDRVNYSPLVTPLLVVSATSKPTGFPSTPLAAPSQNPYWLLNF